MSDQFDYENLKKLLDMSSPPHKRFVPEPGYEPCRFTIIGSCSEPGFFEDDGERRYWPLPDTKWDCHRRIQTNLNKRRSRG